tara:strand:+ start:330 stop:584 length:255 start_codon:yes stop_codon:yes gene_type:complete
MDEKPLWGKLLKFASHLAVGAVVFICISTLAVLLSMWIVYLEGRNVNPIIIKGLTGFEYFLFGLDLLLAGYFVVMSTWKLVKEI